MSYKYKMTNGATLEYKNNNWYRNGKLITDNVLKKYKFYDRSIKGYRYLTEFGSTPVYTPNYDYALFKDIQLKSDYNKYKEEQKAPYIHNKKVVLHSLKNGKPTVVHGRIYSTNQLDSLLKWTNEAGYPDDKVFRVIAHNIKENNYPNIFINKDNDLKNHSKDFDLNSNNFSYWRYSENPYTSLVGSFTTGVNGKALDKAEQEGDIIKVDSLTADTDKRIGYQLKHIDESKISIPTRPVTALIKDFMTNPNKYNPGQSNYVQMVNNIEQYVRDTPEIKNWYRNRRKTLAGNY